MDFLPNLFSNQYTLALVLVGLLAAAAGLYFFKRWMSKEPIQSLPPTVAADVTASLHPDGPESAAGESQEPSGATAETFEA